MRSSADPRLDTMHRVFKDFSLLIERLLEEFGFIFQVILLERWNLIVKNTLKNDNLVIDSLQLIIEV